MTNVIDSIRELIDQSLSKKDIARLADVVYFGIQKADFTEVISSEELFDELQSAMNDLRAYINGNIKYKTAFITYFNNIQGMIKQKMEKAYKVTGLTPRYLK